MTKPLVQSLTISDEDDFDPVVPFNPPPPSSEDLVIVEEEEKEYEENETLSETSSDDGLSSRLFETYKHVKMEDLIERSPKIIIISNASFLALRHNMWDLERFDNLWYPQENKEFEIISSRDEMTEKYIELKKTGTKLKIHQDIGLKKYTEEATPQEITRFHRNLWKISTSINILEGFVENLLNDLDKVKVISIGDDESERLALKHLQLRFKDNPNFSGININFKPELPVGELALNLETVLKNLETIKNSDKDIEVDGEKFY
jgi:hypothetical protein